MWQKYLYTERFKQDDFKEKVKCIAVTQLLSQSNSLPLRGGPEFVLNFPSQITSRVPAVWMLEPGIMLLNVGKSFHAECAVSLTGSPETRLLVRRDFDLLSHASPPPPLSLLHGWPFYSIRFYTPMHPYYFQRAEGGEWRKEQECHSHGRHVLIADPYGEV